MAAVGAAAARGEEPPAETLARLGELLRSEPLAPEPFLVRGAIAFRRGEIDRAEALLTEAKRRSPRAPAARYLLADLYLRSGRPLPAMAEMSVLHRLLPDASGQLAPALARYAQMPGADRQLQKIVADYPELGPALVEELSGDPRNVELVLALAEQPEARAGGIWRRTLVQTLIDAGDLGGARRLWERLSGVELPAAGIFNPGFEPSEAPPPFGWYLATDGGGIAEASSGGLQILYYGREDLDLAVQTLLLPPGRYRLGMTLSGDVGDERGLRWQVLCTSDDRRLLELPLPTEAGQRQVSGEFTVPSGGCDAQRLELTAVGQEFPKEAEFRISGLTLARAGS